MNAIPEKVKKKLLQYEQKCQRADEGDCAGRITWEHALVYAGKQVQEDWALLFICARHHGVDEYQDKGLMNKEKHELIALNQAPPEAFDVYYKSNWRQRLKYLNTKYGEYKPTRTLL